jgi:glycerol-1-phosphate dehydrogenase [NAD(P)+]
VQLARILTAPLVVDVRRGAVADLGVLLADRRIVTESRSRSVLVKATAW